MKHPIVNIIKEHFIPDTVRVEFGGPYDIEHESYVTVFHGPYAHKRATDYALWVVEKRKEEPCQESLKQHAVSN